MRTGFESIPADWSLARIDRVASVNGRIGWKALTAAEYQDDGYAFLATPNIKHRDIDFANVNYISRERYEESPELKLAEGDVLLAKDGNTLGITNVVRSLPRPATVNGSIAVIRPRRVDPRFLYYVLASATIQGIIGAVKDGMGVRHLFQWDIKRLPVPLPPPETQRRIADFLDAETARIDAVKRARSAQIELLAEFERSILDNIFYSSKSRTTTRLKRLLAVRPRYGVLVPQFVDGGVPFIRVNDLEDLDERADQLRTIPPELSAQYPRTVVQPGDLLISVVGTLGRAAIAPGTLSGANIARAVCSIRVAPGIEAELVLAWFKTSAFQRQALVATSTDTAQPTLGMEDLGNFQLVWPSDRLERQQLLARLTSVLESVKRLRKCLARQRVVLEERRQALITATVTGRIDVATASERSIEGRGSTPMDQPFRAGQVKKDQELGGRGERGAGSVGRVATGRDPKNADPTRAGRA